MACTIFLIYGAVRGRHSHRYGKRGSTNVLATSIPSRACEGTALSSASVGLQFAVDKLKGVPDSELSWDGVT